MNLRPVEFANETAIEPDALDAPVDALNFPSESLVQFDKKRCLALLDKENLSFSLLVHEVLGLMRKDDSRYQISGPVLEELSTAFSRQQDPNAEADEKDCSETAKKAAEAMEDLSYGKSIGYSGKIVSSEPPNMRLFTHHVKVTDRANKDSRSEYVYKVQLVQDYRSLSCIVLSVTTH